MLLITSCYAPVAAKSVSNKLFQEYNKPFDYFVESNSIKIRPASVVQAKFRLINYYFMPELTNCRFNSILNDNLSMSNQVIRLENQNKSIKQNSLFKLLTTGAISFCLGIITIVVIAK